MNTIKLNMLVMLLVTPASAQQPSFPFLQDGGARSAFTSGTYGTCLTRQKSAPENASRSVAEMGAFCLCYGRAIADAINGQEYEALIGGQITESFTRKAQVASNICIARMDPTVQRTEREREVVALRNQCTKEYHATDTDHAAATVREKFCGCYSDAVAKTSRAPMSSSEALNYCENQL